LDYEPTNDDDLNKKNLMIHSFFFGFANTKIYFSKFTCKPIFQMRIRQKKKRIFKQFEFEFENFLELRFKNYFFFIFTCLEKKMVMQNEQ